MKKLSVEFFPGWNEMVDTSSRAQEALRPSEGGRKKDRVERRGQQLSPFGSGAALMQLHPKLLLTSATFA